jgi:hypothetical protein
MTVPKAKETSGAHASVDEKDQPSGWIDHLFTGIPMTWPRVVVFAVVAGVVTAVLNLVPALADTSATDIAVSYEWWLLFGVIIASNCEKPAEAALKVFVFFLVSQPLVYLVEMPFLGASVWGYYRYWFIATIACLPAGALANTMRRRGVPGTIALVLAVVMLASLVGFYGMKVSYQFPRHLITLIFSVVLIVVLVAEFTRAGKARVVAGVVSAILVAASVAYQIWGIAPSSTSAILPEGEWTATLDGPGTVEVDGDELVYSSSQLGSGTVTCTDANGTTIVFDVGMNGDRIPYANQRE